MNRSQWQITCGLILCALAIRGATAQMETVARPEPLEPTVSQKEADLLRQVVTMAETNTGPALALLQRTVGDKSSSAMDFALGNLHLQEGHYPAAEQAYLAALRKFPAFRRAKANLGRVYILQSQPAKAAPIYQALVQNGQATADVLILLGHALLTMESPVSAENAFRQALLLQPADRDALLGLTKCLLQQERHKEAAGLARELCALEPTRSEMWAIRANAGLAQDQTTNAVVTLETARRLGQATPDMLAMLGDLHLNLSQPEDAAARYTEAFAGTNASVVRILRAAEGFILADRQDNAGHLLERAADLAKAAGDSWPTRQRRDFLRLKGDLARLTNDFTSALTTYQELIRDDPLDARVLITLGDMHRQQGKMEEAVMAYERAARIPGHEARALIRQAQTEVGRERYKRAVELLESAQAFDKQPHVARYLDQVRRLAEFSNRPGNP